MNNIKKFFHETANIGIIVFEITGDLLSGLAIYRDVKEIKSTISRDIPESLLPLVKQLDNYLNGQSSLTYKNKINQQGTEFQKIVWDEISKIPYGETKSYQDIAKAINRPKAVRAVGTACGSNNLALLVPCHRVISSSGKITGFRWGNDIKAKLLALESPQKKMIGH